MTDLGLDDDEIARYYGVSTTLVVRLRCRPAATPQEAANAPSEPVAEGRFIQAARRRRAMHLSRRGEARRCS